MAIGFAINAVRDDRKQKAKGACHQCGGKELELLGGRGFCIKEIAVAS
jgi:Zn finger protein HypA/HybF involved in hydrogenase expression